MGGGGSHALNQIQTEQLAFQCFHVLSKDTGSRATFPKSGTACGYCLFSLPASTAEDANFAVFLSLT